MIDVKEHVYHDDPAIGHPDVRTQLRGVCYFFLGNGLIQAAVQHAPAGEGTLYGLLLMDPQQLRSKREALSFDPSTGIQKTMLSIHAEDCDLPAGRKHMSIGWDSIMGLPCVLAKWTTGPLAITEWFYCPDRSNALLAREIRLRNRSVESCRGLLATGIRSRSIARSFALLPGCELELCVLYRITGDPPEIDLEFADQKPFAGEGCGYWNSVSRIHCGCAEVDHLFQAAAVQLPSIFSLQGRADAAIWQYNREWVRDQSLAAHALILCGHHHLARIVLERLLREFISDGGAAADSSEVREADDAELDQNGALLHVLREYVLWTGDLGIIRSNWEKIARTAEFPLQPRFREPDSGLLCNQRDFWERHRVFGIKPGIELTYQVFVSVGLEAAADLARQVGRTAEAAHWRAEADRLKRAVLQHPTFALVTERGLAKRRGLDGALQERIEPQAGHGLPRAVGLARDIPHPLNPDSACALPIVLGFVPPESALAERTLAQLEDLWNQGWQTGGYGRYHMDSDPDSPGPWPFPSLFIARAYLRRRTFDKVWRVIRWLASLPQYPSGAFFEMYGDRIAPPYAQNGIVPWTWAETVMLVMKDILGFQPEENGLRIRPHWLPGLKSASGAVPFRGHRLFFDFCTDEGIRQHEFRAECVLSETRPRARQRTGQRRKTDGVVTMHRTATVRERAGGGRSHAHPLADARGCALLPTVAFEADGEGVFIPFLDRDIHVVGKLAPPGEKNRGDS